MFLLCYIHYMKREFYFENEDEADIFFMKKALHLACRAYTLDETPIGAVIVYRDRNLKNKYELIATAFNRRNKDKNTLRHAEIIAIDKASRYLGDWRLDDCTIYVTLEPCQMCAGAIIQARIPNVVIGAMNKKAGCAGSILNLLDMKEFNHRCNVKKGVLSKEAARLMSDFFKKLRTKK